MRFFEDLHWRPAFKRAAFFVALWLVTIYALSTAFPESFYLGLDSSGGAIALLVNAFFFFLLFAFVTAISERSRRRARGGGAQKSNKPPRAESGTARENGEDGPGYLKGRQNPNTSRKKASRRRRR